MKRNKYIPRTQLQKINLQTKILKKKLKCCIPKIFKIFLILLACVLILFCIFMISKECFFFLLPFFVVFLFFIPFFKKAIKEDKENWEKYQKQKEIEEKESNNENLHKIDKPGCIWLSVICGIISVIPYFDISKTSKYFNSAINIFSNLFYGILIVFLVCFLIYLCITIFYIESEFEKGIKSNIYRGFNRINIILACISSLLFILIFISINNIDMDYTNKVILYTSKEKRDTYVKESFCSFYNAKEYNHYSSNDFRCSVNQLCKCDNTPIYENENLIIKFPNKNKFISTEIFKFGSFTLIFYGIFRLIFIIFVNVIKWIINGFKNKY